MASKTPKSVTLSKFKAKDYAPTDVFQPSSKIPSISEADETKALETLDGQRRAINVAGKNAEVAKALAEAETKAANAATAEVKTLTAWEKYQAAQKGLEGEKLATQAAAEKVTQGKNILAGAKKETGILKQGIAVRHQRMTAKVNHEKAMFSLEAEQMSYELEGFRASINDRFNQLGSAEPND